MNLNFNFVGGESYTQKEMIELFSYINIDEIKIRNSYNILEFGSGISSITISEIFKDIEKFNYYTYESNIEYIQPHERITTIVYDKNNINNLDLKDDIKENTVFDLVLVDGPNGESRKLWYNKIKNFVKPGTIILIDDFNHYDSFGIELDNNFEYDLISFSNEPFVPGGEHSWKIVSVTNIKNL